MAEKFNKRPVLAYRRCKILRDLIGGNKISNNKVVKTQVIPQYVGKSETPLNIRLNNQRKDVQNLQITLNVSQHFREANHSFSRDAKFTLIKANKEQEYEPKNMRRTLEDHEDL